MEDVFYFFKEGSYTTSSQITQIFLKPCVVQFISKHPFFKNKKVLFMPEFKATTWPHKVT